MKPEQGYGKERGNYWIMLLDTNKIVLSCSVHFDETKFPLAPGEQALIDSLASADTVSGGVVSLTAASGAGTSSTNGAGHDSATT